jgi:hypothetical protein
MQKILIAKVIVVILSIALVGYLGISAICGASAGNEPVSSAPSGASADLEQGAAPVVTVILPEPAVPAQAAPGQPESNKEPSAEAEEGATDIILSSGANVPAPDGQKWYDWDAFGRYPGSLYPGVFKRTYAADQTGIYYIKSRTQDGGFKSGALLYRCDADGANAKQVYSIDEPMENTMDAGSTLNVYQGRIYFSTDKAVYRIDANGGGKVKIADRPASDMLLAGGKLFLKHTGDERLYVLGAGEEQALGTAGRRFIAYDGGVLYYCGEPDANGRTDLYFYDTQSGKSGLVFKGFTTLDGGLIAEVGKLVFLDGYYTFCGTVADQRPGLQKDFRPGATPGIVSVDMKTGEKRTIVKIPEAKGKTVHNLTRFDRFYVYTVEGGPDANGNAEVSLFAYDTKTGKRYQLSQFSNESPMSVLTAPKSLFIGGYRVVFYQGRAGLKKAGPGDF